MSHPTEKTVWLVLKKGRYYKSIKLVRWAMREPTLKSGEKAIKLKLTMPWELFEPAPTNVTITIPEQPVTKVEQQD